MILTLKSAPTKPRTTIRPTDPLLLSGNSADLRLQFQPRLCLELTLSDFCLENPLSLSSDKGAVDPPGGKQGLKLGPIYNSWQSGRDQAISQPPTMWCKKNTSSLHSWSVQSSCSGKSLKEKSNLQELIINKRAHHHQHN